MIRELVLHTNSKGVEIALLENKKLVEYHVDVYENDGCAAGNIYLGKIKKLNPALNAAFVDIGHEKDAFIHYSDLSPYIKRIKTYTLNARNDNKTTPLEDFCDEPLIEKNGKIEDVFQRGDLVMFEVAKEAISTKGPRLTCEISLPGRYIVLTPFNSSIGVSKKIGDDQERQRLYHICERHKPAGFGVVVRTNAQDISEAELTKDIKKLHGKWKKMVKNMYLQQKPLCIHEEINKSFSLIRDILNDSFEKITTDSEHLYGELKTYIEEHIPDKIKLLHLYQSHSPIFEEFEISRQVKTAFGKIVTLKSGAYLIMEHTEALQVIDVNSGPKIKKDVDQDTNAFNINSEAAQEIARQLRLRNIGGIIVVDFIDMKSAAYKAKILELMQESMKSDKARHVILPISKFGLMEITRQRVKEQVMIDVSEPIVTEQAKAEEPLQIIEVIYNDLNRLNKHQPKSYLLYVHPFIYAFLKQGTFSFRMKWYAKTNKWIKLIQDSSLKLAEYKLLVRETGEKAFK
jgi:ribonuclease G